MTEKTAEELRRAEAEARAAARDAALAARLTAVSTELGKVSGPALTLPETVFRQREITAAALAGAADRTAETIASVAVAAPVLVTASTDLVRAVLLARALLATISQLTAEARALLQEDRGGLGLRTATEAAPEESTEATVPADPIAALAALAVSGLNLLAVETTVTASSGTATELETHIPLLQRLIERQVPVLHSSLGIPATDNRVLTAFATLTPLAAALDALAAAAAEGIERLGKEPPEHELAPLVEVKTRAEALGRTIVAFVAATTTVDAETGVSPLIAAAAADRLLVDGEAEAAYVAVVLPAQIDAHQVSLKRRLFAPRLVVSASATIDVVVIDLVTRRTEVAASHTVARSFQARFPMWFWPWGTQASFGSRPQMTALPAPPLFEEPAAVDTAGNLRPPVSQAPEADMNPPLA